MNKRKLDLAKEQFLELYPLGFDDPRMEEIRKKHKPFRMREEAEEIFRPDAFGKPAELLENTVRLVTRSSMVSVFEKPRFRDLVRSLNGDEKELFAHGMRELLHGNRQFGFDTLLDLLSYYKLAKWTLLTICPYYFKPTEEVFIKPTTAKSAIEYFELKDLHYSARPSFEFYEAYRKRIGELMVYVDVTDDFAAFGGFIMITTGLMKV